MQEDVIIETTNKQACASAPRAFFAVFLFGLFIMGAVQREATSFKMYKAYSACGFGVLVSAFLAIRWRKEPAFMGAFGRLYLVFVASTCAVGILAGDEVAAAALGASLPAGILCLMPGVALFYWRNLFTHIALGTLVALFAFGFLMKVLK